MQNITVLKSFLLWNTTFFSTDQCFSKKPVEIKLGKVYTMLNGHAIKARTKTQATKDGINDISKSPYSVYSKDKAICNSFGKGFIKNVSVRSVVAEMIYVF